MRAAPLAARSFVPRRNLLKQVRPRAIIPRIIPKESTTMTRTIAITAALAACLALPALAETPATNAGTPAETGTAAKGNLFT
jgi:hypothetical protein